MFGITVAMFENMLEVVFEEEGNNFGTVLAAL
jgi:hypothetical protein